MDTTAEAVFDRAVELATQVLGTPVALLSLVDAERQFFKAQKGLPEPYATDRQTPLSHSFCQYVVATGAPLTVNDARKDPLVAENDAIEDLGVVAYLGVPVRDADGAVLGSFCAIADTPREWTATERAQLASIAVGVESEIALRRELLRRQAAEREVRASEERLRLALRAGRLGTFDLDPRSGDLKWDVEMHALWWVEPSEPDPYAAAQSRIHPLDREADRAALEAALDAERSSGRYNAELRVVHPETQEIRWLHIDADVEFEDGVASRVVGTTRDVTDRRLAQEANGLLTRELNHRVKNLFAITAGMVRLTARTAESPVEMGDVIRGRIEALAAAHNLIEPKVFDDPSHRPTTTLVRIIEKILAPHTSPRRPYSTAGPSVEVGARASSGLALILHEMATNAAKYGGLAVDGGRIDIRWTVSSDGADAPHLDLVWQETGSGAPGDSENRQGFGTALIDRTVTGQFLGEWSRQRRSSGMRIDIRMRLASILN